MTLYLPRTASVQVADLSPELRICLEPLAEPTDNRELRLAPQCASLDTGGEIGSNHSNR
jgi:hypothetical protein